MVGFFGNDLHFFMENCDYVGAQAHNRRQYNEYRVTDTLIHITNYKVKVNITFCRTQI